MFTYLTAGESHGKTLTAIIKKIPSGLPLTQEMIDVELARRQCGYGRGGRMKIEQDRVEITSGVRYGKTLGSPLTLQITNRDWINWTKVMSIEPLDEVVLVGDAEQSMDVEFAGSVEKHATATAGIFGKMEVQPRPGHADLTGAIKYRTKDMRDILERASARETAARTAVGAVCREFLRHFGVEIWSHVIQIGKVIGPDWYELALVEDKDNYPPPRVPIRHYFAEVEKSPVRCGDERIAQRMMHQIDSCREEGDSLGGVFEIAVTGVPVGLGSYIQWDERLDGKLAQALTSIQAIKGVEFGIGFDLAGRLGSQAHDEIFYQRYMDEGGEFYRSTNYAGGLEGGMTNGESLVLRAVMKPIPTLTNPLHTVDVLTKEETFASKERSDVCAVPAASVVGEAAVAIVLAQAMASKFGGDNLTEMQDNFRRYLDYVRNY